MIETWAANLRRIAFGRPAWSPAREYGYYRVSSKVIQEHASRQVAHARSDFAFGRRLAESIGLDTPALVAGASVLDIGAGECALSQALAFALGAAQVVALDAVPKQIWAAAAQRRDERLRCVIADASDLPFGDGSFDLVTCHLVLHHIEPLMPVLNELRRVLAPGGRLLVMEPAPLAGMLVHGQLSENEAPVPLAKLKRVCSEAGFSQVDSDYWWERFRTRALGPLSPNYRVRAIVPGDKRSAKFTLRRPLDRMSLPGLEIDRGCRFAEMATAHGEEIKALWPSSTDVPGFPQLG
jgi:SAM-dependent methyltransferase